MDNQEYQWTDPADWLVDHLSRAKAKQVKTLAIRLASQMDSGTIQEMFQSEMACDGYFTPFLIQPAEEKM